jgi:hypothetical protein
MAMKIQVEFFWVVMLYSVVVQYQCWYPITALCSLTTWKNSTWRNKYFFWLLRGWYNLPKEKKLGHLQFGYVHICIHLQWCYTLPQHVIYYLLFHGLGVPLTVACSPWAQWCKCRMSHLCVW